MANAITSALSPTFTITASTGPVVLQLSRFGGEYSEAWERHAVRLMPDGASAVQAGLAWLRRNRRAGCLESRIQLRDAVGCQLANIWQEQLSLPLLGPELPWRR